MTRILSIVALLMLIAYPAAATSFWLSPYGTELGSTQPTSLDGIPTIYNFDSQGAGSVYIWAQTDPNRTLKNWSLRVKSTDVSVLSLTNSTIYNPTLGSPGNVRWEYTIDANGNSSTSDDFMGFTITNDPNNDTGLGIGPSTATVDSLYYGPSDGSGSWLLAKLDYTLDTTSGTTQLFLQIGALGLNNVGETSADTQVLFGHTGDTPFDDAGEGNRQTNGSNKVDAVVRVLPVPDADFDNDTLVTGADFLIWQENVGDPNSSLNSEGNATFAIDSDVNGIDLAAWEFQYGKTIPKGGSLMDVATVPEPATWALVCLTLSGLLTRGRRKRTR